MRALPLAVLLALLLVAAPAAAQRTTLDALEEPARSEGGAAPTVIDVTITPDEAARTNYVVFYTPPGRGMSAKLVDADGRTVWEEPRAVNGVRPFAPNATVGDHKLVLSGAGQLQVVHRVLHAPGGAQEPTETNATLSGGTDAYLFRANEAWRLDFTGDVDVTWTRIGVGAETLTPPASASAVGGHPYVATFRGEPGAAYAVTMAPDDAPAEDAPAETPGPAAPALALAVALVALAWRRRLAAR